MTMIAQIQFFHLAKLILSDSFDKFVLFTQDVLVPTMCKMDCNDYIQYVIQTELQHNVPLMLM